MLRPYTLKTGGKTQAQYLLERGLKDANDKGDFDNISANKARKILHDKKVNGKPLTPEQFRLFGYLSEGHTMKYKMGGLSKMGYRDDSPYRHMESIDIDSPNGTIDMSQTGIPLYAEDDLGDSRILAPYSGMHQFKGTKITERPLNPYQGGGMTSEDFEDLLWGDWDANSGTSGESEQEDSPPTEEEIMAPKNNEEYDRTLAMAMNIRAEDEQYANNRMSEDDGPINYREQEMQFAGERGKQIIADISESLGYTPQFNSVKRTIKQQEALVRQGWGVKNSYHLTGDAVDMKPSDWQKIPEPRKQELRSKYDVIYHNNHYHLEPK